jgi:hypothetical protein
MANDVLVSDGPGGVRYTFDLSTVLTPQRVLRSAGLVAVYSAAAATVRFWNDGDSLLHVKNGSGSSITVTLPYHPGFEESADRVFTVNAGSEIFAGPFPPRDFNPQPDFVAAHDFTPAHASLPVDAVATYARLIFSATASVTFALIGVDVGAVKELV